MTAGRMGRVIREPDEVELPGGAQPPAARRASARAHAGAGMLILPVAGLITRLLGNGRIALAGSNSTVGPFAI